MPTRDTLVLFDIDGTLLTTKGVGLAALRAACERVVGGPIDIDRVNTAGRLDPLITQDLLLAANVEPTLERIADVRDHYADEMARTLVPSGATHRFEGALELVESVAEHTSSCSGVLTGNYASTGRQKLTAAGFDAKSFELCVWGDESPHDPPARDHLTGVAIERAPAHMGREIEGGHVVIIGDTPHDIACARAHGCRVLAVATGQFTSQDLRDADLVVESLADTGTLMDWIFRD